MVYCARVTNVNMVSYSDLEQFAYKHKIETALNCSRSSIRTTCIFRNRVTIVVLPALPAQVSVQSHRSLTFDKVPQPVNTQTVNEEHILYRKMKVPGSFA
jgi:hypothetical protein